METQYQRGKIQSRPPLRAPNTLGTPLVGINTFVDPATTADDWESLRQLRRSTNAEKDDQITRLRAFQDLNKDQAAEALARLQAVDRGGNVFGEREYRPSGELGTDHRGTVQSVENIAGICSAGDTLRLPTCGGHRESREKIGPFLAEVLDEGETPCSIEQHGSRRPATLEVTMRVATNPLDLTSQPPFGTSSVCAPWIVSHPQGVRSLRVGRCCRDIPPQGVARPCTGRSA